MNDYFEHEVKVLNVDVETLKNRLIDEGAKVVFSGNRIISTFDDDDYSYAKRDILIRLTEEGSIKITVHINNTSVNRQIIKLHVMEDRDKSKDFLYALHLYERTRLNSYRTSFELGNVDFDIDQFPLIPPFLEIDTENLKCSLKTLLSTLGLETNQIVTCGTEEIFKMYGIDYFSSFASS